MTPHQSMPHHRSMPRHRSVYVNSVMNYSHVDSTIHGFSLLLCCCNSSMRFVSREDSNVDDESTTTFDQHRSLPSLKPKKKSKTPKSDRNSKGKGAPTSLCFNSPPPDSISHSPLSNPFFKVSQEDQDFIAAACTRESFFEEEVALGDIKELYQLKKPPLSASIYLTPWTSGKNLVTPIPALKKRFKHGWFIVDDDWASTVEFRGRVSHVFSSPLVLAEIPTRVYVDPKEPSSAAPGLFRKRKFPEVAFSLGSQGIAAFMLMKDYDLARESSSTKYEEEMEDPEFEAPYLEPFVSCPLWVVVPKPRAGSGYCHDRTLPGCNRSGPDFNSVIL
ncbi:hypothetical protein CUMW_176150 [Citrus unshiu]|uniref:Uncharacterized protein n=1 Tax=Citrus unshiu TaxID=55188 RepID=A0A2H5PXC0_CITUN|nr:hypothetical protein CUMW_176150 [Citrus unshiu]